MKKNILILSFFLILLASKSLYTKNSITSKKCGRLGDSVLILSKTLLLSQKHDFEFLYIPLPGLKHFAIHKVKKHYNKEVHKLFDHMVKINNEDQLHKLTADSTNNIIYIVIMQT